MNMIQKLGKYKTALDNAKIEQKSIENNIERILKELSEEYDVKTLEDAEKLYYTLEQKLTKKEEELEELVKLLEEQIGG